MTTRTDFPDMRPSSAWWGLAWGAPEGEYPARLTGPGGHAILVLWQAHHRVCLLIIPHKTRCEAKPNTKGHLLLCCLGTASPWKAGGAYGPAPTFMRAGAGREATFAGSG